MKPTDAISNSPQDIYDFLMRGFNAAAPGQREDRWDWLIAAHVAVQQQYALHWRVHWEMLRFALALRDYREAAGQLMRLALVPLGHAFGRLPAGNTGRANVNAFRPMAVSDRTQALLCAARESARRLQ
ncbi:MAG: DUF3703 domain-containing protein [Gallionella sp.]|nr:DUF3703 domain-containing protein [Gallionella sp.]